MGPLTEAGITTGGQVLIAMITVLGGVLGALINSGRRWSKRAVTAAEHAGDKADDAAELSRPTGNGYAARTEATLTRISTELHDLRTEVRTLDGRVRRYHEEDPQ